MKNLSEMNYTTPATVLTAGKVKEVTVPVYKRLTFFFLATNALLLAGQLVFQSFSWLDFLLLQWCGLTGVLVVYRFNDMIDHSRDFSFNVQLVLGNKLNLFVVLQLVFLLIPVAFREFSAGRIVALLLICFLGVLYSVKFRLNGRFYRIKHIFMVKNLLIGVLWGALIPVGADNFSDPQVLGLFVFTSLQVMIGSIIRDIPDRASDRLEGVQTLPVMIGFPASMRLLHLFNGMSLVSAVGLFPVKSFAFMLLVVVFWRMILLICIRRKPNNTWFTNTLNLFTCVIILVSLAIKLYFYGY